MIGTVFRAHHRALQEALEAYREEDAFSPEGFERLQAFLTAELLPHARGEEQALYPAVEPLIRQHGEATATMRVDHAFIEDYVRRICEEIERIRRTGPAERAEATRRLRQQIIELSALLRVHMAKEEQVYLPLLERHLPPEAQQRLLEAMHRQGEPMGPAVVRELDVRSVPPPQRHPMIFQTFEALRPGEAFILINDHDPRPLYYQFQYERPGQFTWVYLEEGPEVWRVRIGKAASPHP